MFAWLLIKVAKFLCRGVSDLRKQIVLQNIIFVPHKCNSTDAESKYKVAALKQNRKVAMMYDPMICSTRSFAVHI